MDYEKAYKEALLRAKEWSDGKYGHSVDDTTCEIAEYIFPELKESEDERIRKALIDGFTVMKESKNCGKTFSNHNIPVVDILAWLEKQGEQKPSAWSEDDEEHIHSIISTIECCKAEYKDAIAVIEQYNSDLDWLKSIKDRVQPKQEWSEENCNQIETIVCHLDNIGNGAMAESLLNIMDKYKSLRPQKQWKPSEEQLKSLEQAARYYNCGKIKLVGTHLNEIIKQLKAL